MLKRDGSGEPRVRLRAGRERGGWKFDVLRTSPGQLRQVQFENHKGFLSIQKSRKNRDEHAHPRPSVGRRGRYNRRKTNERVGGANFQTARGNCEHREEGFPRSRKLGPECTSKGFQPASPSLIIQENSGKRSMRRRIRISLLALFKGGIPPGARNQNNV